MKEKLREMMREALSAIMPVTLIVFIFTVIISPISTGTLMLFLVGAAMLTIGIGLLTTGVDMSLIKLGSDIGASMTKTRKILVVCVVSFALGMTISMAEPDLQVLSRLVPGIERWTLLITVSFGVGLSLLLAVLRIIFHIKLSMIIPICYAVMIVLAVLAPDSIVPVAFDAGGVVTGPIAVPFILAMGLGITAVRGDKNSLEDSFGLVSLCIIGPVISVLSLGLLSNPEAAAYEPAVIPALSDTRDVMLTFAHDLPHISIDIARSIWPIVAVLFVYQLLTRHYGIKELLRLLVGLGYAYVGLVIFMTGVEVGFIPVGMSLGADLAASPMNWIIVPFAALIGYFVVAAEPAVHTLRKQVEDVSLGRIPGNSVLRYLSIGVAVMLALSMVRILLEIPIYWLIIPCYIAAAVLMFFTPKLYTGIAFDAAGTVTGPMTSTFLLPLAIGACANPDRIMHDAFGTIALIAITPPISIQLMGIIFDRRMKTGKSIHDFAYAFSSDGIEDSIVFFNNAYGLLKGADTDA